MDSRSYPAFACVAALQRAAQDRVSGQDAQPGAARTLSGNERRSVAELLDALHSVFEDLLLDQLTWQHAPELASLLFDMATLLGAEARMVRLQLLRRLCFARASAACVPRLAAYKRAALDNTKQRAGVLSTARLWCYVVAATRATTSSSERGSSAGRSVGLDARAAAPD